MADRETSVEEPGWEDGIPEYLREVSDLRFINISIKSYEKKTGGGFPREEYYAFRVISILTSEEVNVCESSLQQQDGSKKRRQEVWRRYSEFETLRSFLSTVYPYIIIPPLPEKAIKGTSGLLSRLTFSGDDSDFLVRRQQALEIFLVRISRHPVLSRNYWFHQFLNNIGWREAVQRTGYSIKSDTLLQALSLQLTRQRTDQRFVEVKDYADELESVFKSLLDIRERMNESVKAVYKVHTNYGRILSEWSEIEDTIGTAVQLAGGCMDSYSESIETYLEEEEVRYFTPLKEYVAYCEAMRALVRRHDLLEKRLEKTEHTLSAKADAKEVVQREGSTGVEIAGEGGGGGGEGGGGGKRFSLRAFSNKFRSVDMSETRLSLTVRELQEAEDSRKQAQKELESFTSHALKELERFHEQKVADFKSILVNFVQLQLHMHRKGMDTWERMKQGFSTMH